MQLVRPGSLARQSQRLSSIDNLHDAEQALRQDSSNLIALFVKALAKEHLNKLDEALESYRQVLRIFDPQSEGPEIFIKSCLGIVRVAARMDDYYLKEFHKISDKQAYLHRALSHAIDLNKKFACKCPEDWRCTSQILQELGMSEEAKECLEIARRLGHE